VDVALPASRAGRLRGLGIIAGKVVADKVLHSLAKIVLALRCRGSRSSRSSTRRV
jgi:hypothetical protein